MLAWSEGTDNGRQKPEIMVMTSLQAESYLLITLITRKLVTKLNLCPQINRRRTLPASFPLVDALPQAAWPERLLSEKSGRCGIAAD